MLYERGVRCLEEGYHRTADCQHWIIPEYGKSRKNSRSFDRIEDNDYYRKMYAEVQLALLSSRLAQTSFYGEAEEG
jgi:hypothetical protein